MGSKNWIKQFFPLALVLIALGTGFLAAPYVDSGLSGAFTSGSYLWISLGSIASGFGIRVNRHAQKQYGAIPH